MGRHHDDTKLRRRTIAGLRDEIEAFGRGPIYERLGFRDFGFVEMWELRR
jgi:hypothetical protein